jgi:hypothetical protein
VTRVPLDMRILAALRFVDAVSRSTITAPVSVTGVGVRVIRNLSGMYVIAEAPGTARYTTTFELPRPPLPPIPPVIGSVGVALTIVDPAGRYLPRTATIAVPRDPDPLHDDAPASLFRPIDVELFPSPTMPIAVGWATVRLSVKRAGSERGLPFAFVRVRRASDNVVLARGLADERGEVLVGVPGIPVTTWSTEEGDPVTTTTITARISACFDPAAFDTSTTFPDPKALEAAFSTLPHSSDLQLDLASGQEVARRIDVPLPP